MMSLGSLIFCSALAGAGLTQAASERDSPSNPDTAISRSGGVTPLRAAATEISSSGGQLQTAHRPLPSLAANAEDKLFGTEDAAANTGAAFQFNGFLDGLAAYTYSNPTHWSRAVARLQLNAQGSIADKVKWKIGGRVEADPVYYSSNFYLDSVKHNERTSFIQGENYLDVSAGDWDFRVGAQQIVWGEVVGLFYADVVSARDMREFLLPSFDIIRIPQWATRAEYFAGDTHLELVWIPVPTFDKIGKPGSDFYPARLPSPTPVEVAGLFQDPQEPSHNLHHTNYGLRANTLLSGWDVAAFYYRSFATEPTFYRVAPVSAGQAFSFQPLYDRIWQAGGTVSKDLDGFVLRGETVYTHGQGYTVADLAAPISVVKRSSLEYILSVEFSLPHDTRLDVQAFQWLLPGGSESDLAIKSTGAGASILLSSKINDAFEPQILWIQNFSHAGGMIKPRLNWYPVKNITVGIGADVFTGPDNGFFGRFNNRNRLYTEMRLDF